MLSFDELTALSRKDLVARWSEHFGAHPPKKMRSNTLARILSCEAQWEASGENRAALRSQLERVAASSKISTAIVSDGTSLVREWHGREYVVDVIDGQYNWNGKTWSSLSAIARQITGTKWSGPRFFGISR